MTEHFKPGLSYAIVLLDVLVYSIYIPYFPVILGNYVSDSQWLRMQSLANLVAVVFAVVTGAVYDRFGGFAGLVLSQMCCLVTSLMLWYGSIALSIKSNNRGSEMVMEIDWVYICYLVSGFVLRKSNRTYAVISSIMTDKTHNVSLRERRLSSAAGMFGIGFALGPALAGVLSDAFTVNEMFKFGFALACLNMALNVNTFKGASILRAVPKAVKNTPDQRTRKVSTEANETTKSSVQVEGSSLPAQVSKIMLHPDLILILIIHGLTSFGQFCYISTVTLLIRDRFFTDPNHFGRLLSYFGITFSVSMWIIVPRLGSFFSEISLLIFGLIITALMRLINSCHNSLLLFYVAHTFIGLGTASISFVITNIVTRKGRAYEVTGSLVGGE
mmetsp:Transcript_24510/g.29948  ORF Transcript_24510/g.29948 Transcript_24510/m.29948 type:complete len:386 (+) Transcript_24510:133-1290(+)